MVAFALVESRLASDLLYIGLGLLGSGAIVLGVRLHRPPHPLPWYLMALGQLVWSVGDAVGAWFTDVLGHESFPSPADGFYLAAYPILAIGLVLLNRGRRRHDLAGFLDSAIVAVALGMLSWVLVAQPTIRMYQESWLATVVALAYPIGDIVLIGVLVRLLTTPGGRTRSLRLLLGAVGLLVVADTAALALSLLVYDQAGPVDLIWLASYVTWGAASLHPTMRRLSEPSVATSPAFGWVRFASLCAAVLIGPATLVVQEVAGGRVDVWAVAIGSLLIGLLVVARMSTIIGQTLAANRLRDVAQEELTHQAAHDALTGLPNRAQAMRLITGALVRAQHSGARVGLIFVDLDGFKRINDSLGHAAGDEVLRVVSARLRAQVRGGDVLARLGGDEFVVLLDTVDDEATAIEVADRLVRATAEPVPLSGGNLGRLGASAGVAVSLDGGVDGRVDADALLGEADVAVYRAKTLGRGRTEVYDGRLRREEQERADLERRLSGWLAYGGLGVEMLPIAHLPEGVVMGYQMRLGWPEERTHGTTAEQVIEVALRSDLICDLDAWLLRAGLHKLAEQGPDATTVASVGISWRYLVRSRMLDDVRSALAASGVEPERLAIEIHETSLSDDVAAMQHLHELRRIGVRIMLAEFGTGPASISRLDTLPVDGIRIASRFLDADSETGPRLFGLIVKTAHAFRLPVVAVGVDTDDALMRAVLADCEFGQGTMFERSPVIVA